MKIGVPKEIKHHEYRVGMTPGCVKSYVGRGHAIMIETGAGDGAGFSDSDCVEAGAKVAKTAAEVYGQAEMVVKVKEPLPSEYELLQEGQILYTYLHLAASGELARTLMARKISGLAYETIQEDDGTLPCLVPMSEIAGRLAVQAGVTYLEKPAGGRGVLLGGVPGVERGRVLILGGGVVGLNACKIAVGLGAQVTVMDINTKRLGYLDDIFRGGITTLFSNRTNIERSLPEADLLVGAVLIPGAKAPHLVKRADLKMMKAGALIVDVAVDQGGCVETTEPRTYDDPTYVVEGVLHYTVANMPGAVPVTATAALVNQTTRYGLLVAEAGIDGAIEKSAAVKRGMNTYRGRCVHAGVAEALDLPYAPLKELMT